MAKKVARRRTAPTEVKALVVREIALTSRQMGIISAATPPALIKSKQGRGGKRVSFVEGGYVISMLNAAFSPLGWDFEIVDQGESSRTTEKNAEGEVWVRGKLTVNDHKNGYSMSKTQYGQHPIHKNVPIGDAFKAAGTDALKKCASMLGIALDVYWAHDERVSEAKDAKLTPADMFERAKAMLRSVRNIDVLLEYKDKLKDSKNFTKEQVAELTSFIGACVDNLDANDSK